MSTPDLSDKYPEIPFLCGFKSFGGLKHCKGQIVTVECPNDNTFVRELLSNDGAGCVLFVNGFKSNDVALLGDNLAELAVNNNWSGVIVYGCVRDVEILQTIELAVFALGACPKKSLKAKKGIINASFHIDEVEIKNGYWVYADQNGILISPHDLLS